MGRPAFFIRLGGCDVGCSWCDVKDSWEASDHPSLSIAEIVEACVSSGAGYCVITGGEPMMYNLGSLTSALKSAGIYLMLETSGAHPLSGSWDWICLSPKKFKAAREEYYEVADELKVIVYNKHDLGWAEEHAAKVNSKCALYMQPEWSKVETSTAMILNFIRENTEWRISVQSHKYIGVP